MEGCLLFVIVLGILALVFGALTLVLGLPYLEWYQALGLLVFVAIIGGMFNWLRGSSSN